MEFSQRESVSLRTRPRLRLPFAAALALGLVTLLGACISGIDSRESARAEVSGPDGLPVRLITSTEFVQTQTQPGTPDSLGVQIFSADTSFRDLPFEVSEDISATRRYLVRVSQAPETDSVADSGSIDASIVLYIDGERRSEATGDLRESSVQVLFQSFTNQ